MLATVGALSAAGPVTTRTAAAAETGSWSSVFGDSRNSGTATVPTPTSLVVSWRHAFDDIISGYSVQLGSEIYLPVGSEVVAFDMATRTERWRASLAGRGTFGLATTEETVIAGTTTNEGIGSVQAFERTDGTLRWEASVETSLQCAPAVGSDTVYIGDEGGTVTALSLASGAPEWTDTGESVRGGPLALTDGAVFAQSRNGVVRALDRETGNRNWTVDFAVEGFGTPAAGTDGLYTGGYRSEGSVVASLALESGDHRWKRSLEGTVAFPGALTDDHFVVQTGRRLLALDRDDGRTVWEAPVSGGGGIVVTETAICAITPSALSVHSPTDGTKLGSFSPSAELQWLPIPRQDGLLVVTGDGRLLSLTAATGPDEGVLAVGGGGVLAALLLGYRYLTHTGE